MIPKILVDIAQGEPTGSDMKEALSYFDNALRRNPKFHESHRGRAELLALQAREALLDGRLPESAIQSGLESASQAIQLNPMDSLSHLVKAQLHLLAAQAERGAARNLFLVAAETEAGRALEIDRDLADAHVVLAKIAEIRRRPEEGLKHIDAAQKINPRHADSFGALARLLELQAQLARHAEERAARRAQARQALSHALSLNRYLRREYAVLSKELAE